MSHIIRDAPVGQVLRLLTGNRVLKYPEEEDDFRLPDTWTQLLNRDNSDVALPQPSGILHGSSSTSSTSPTDDEEKQQNKADGAPYQAALARTKSREETAPNTADRLEVDQQHELEKTKSIPIVPRRTQEGAILVDWYYTDDAANPQNWSSLRRGLVAYVICTYTFVVYTSSAIYTTSEEGIIEAFGVNMTEASLGLALFVLGYGVGPLLFSPLSELPSIGRNPVYMWTMFLFVMVSIPAALVQDFAGLMVLRFLQGFFGSPCLANGAASFGDMYSMMALPYAMSECLPCLSRAKWILLTTYS